MRRKIRTAPGYISQPDRFVTTVESFMKTMATLGPIVRDAETRSRLQALYDAPGLRGTLGLGGQLEAALGNRLSQSHA